MICGRQWAGPRSWKLSGAGPSATCMASESSHTADKRRRHGRFVFVMTRLFTRLPKLAEEEPELKKRAPQQ
ncbi:hypothetical protein CDL15_Pgr009816 [Punica granatum]|uniref:Uncharacterized protein n=1 Tax=Punica granatum TaxID=22663 RepID=A0A218WUY0_PUNGR|nr:hypothetical protein CDL15_Pgr009816 [Punica granatum]